MDYESTQQFFGSHGQLRQLRQHAQVVNDVTVSNAAPYVMATALDLKSYRDSKGYRQIPVG
jgi:hypothetical protein